MFLVSFVKKVHFKVLWSLHLFYIWPLFFPLKVKRSVVLATSDNIHTHCLVLSSGLAPSQGQRYICLVFRVQPVFVPLFGVMGKEQLSSVLLGIQPRVWHRGNLPRLLWGRHLTLHDNQKCKLGRHWTW